MKLTSPAFDHNGDIPSKYTCQGLNISPPLQISDVPENAKSLVLIMDDPDVPKEIRPDGIWDHWVVFNIPPETPILPEADPPGMHGSNTSGRPSYEGPCPPDRKHRYFFKLYALDMLLEVPFGATKAEVEKAMKGHVIEKTELVGLYEKA